METNTRNFHAHGGNEWVIGGKLTFLPGAVVEGAEGLFDVPDKNIGQLENIPASTATSNAALREDFNRLLSVLKEAGAMKPDAVEAGD